MWLPLSSSIGLAAEKLCFLPAFSISLSKAQQVLAGKRCTEPLSNDPSRRTENEEEFPGGITICPLFKITNCPTLSLLESQRKQKQLSLLSNTKIPSFPSVKVSVFWMLANG